MSQHLGLVSLVVLDYDEAIAYYAGTQGLTLRQGTYQPSLDKRWVVVAPPKAKELGFVLARATSEKQ
jgi:hypothetical protein